MTFITNMLFKFKPNIFQKPIVTKHTFFWCICLFTSILSETLIFWYSSIFIIHKVYHLKIIEGKIYHLSLITHLITIVNKRSFIGLFSGKLSLDLNLIFFKSFPFSIFSPPLIVRIWTTSQTSLYFFETSLFSFTSPKTKYLFTFFFQSDQSFHQSLSTKNLHC